MARDEDVAQTDFLIVGRLFLSSSVVQSVHGPREHDFISSLKCFRRCRKLCRECTDQSFNINFVIHLYWSNRIAEIGWRTTSMADMSPRSIAVNGTGRPLFVLWLLPIGEQRVRGIVSVHSADPWSPWPMAYYMDYQYGLSITWAQRFSLMLSFWNKKENLWNQGRISLDYPTDYPIKWTILWF